MRILVTGARQGLGLEFVRQYASNKSCNIIATCLEPDSANELRVMSREAEGRIAVQELDVDNHKQIDALANSLRGKAIDIFINNAGIKGPEAQEFGTVDYQAWLDVLKTNLLGPMKVTEAFVEHIAASDRKLVVMMASGLGSLLCDEPNTPGPDAGGLIYYRTSKVGLNMIVRNLAVDLCDRGISVVALAPGHVRTEMGGPDAPLSVQDSISSLCEVINNLGPSDTGKFLLYDGSAYPW